MAKRTSKRASRHMSKKPASHGLDFGSLLVAVLFCEAAGVATSLFTVVSVPDWYNVLNKPFFAPPTWLFAPIWVALYLLMGIAGYIIWKAAKTNRKARVALLLFTFQLMMNFAWTAVFFGQRSVDGGMLVMALLWISVLATIVWFWHVSKRAAVLLFPYLIWVIFAMAINLYIVLFNAV